MCVCVYKWFLFVWVSFQETFRLRPPVMPIMANLPLFSSWFSAFLNWFQMLFSSWPQGPRWRSPLVWFVVSTLSWHWLQGHLSFMMSIHLYIYIYIYYHIRSYAIIHYHELSYPTVLCTSMHILYSGYVEHYRAISHLHFSQAPRWGCLSNQGCPKAFQLGACKPAAEDHLHPLTWTLNIIIIIIIGTWEISEFKKLAWIELDGDFDSPVDHGHFGVQFKGVRIRLKEIGYTGKPEFKWCSAPNVRSKKHMWWPTPSTWWWKPPAKYHP